jgi:hypothetical protein
VNHRAHLVARSSALERRFSASNVSPQSVMAWRTLCPQGGGGSRAAPCTSQKRCICDEPERRQWCRVELSLRPTPHRKRRSRRGRCTSVRPAGKRQAGSPPSSCAGREHWRSSGSTITCRLLRASTCLQTLIAGISTRAPLLALGIRYLYRIY